MYTVEERTNTLNEMLSFFKSMNETEAILLLGSGVTGFKDIYSDIDLSIVVENIDDAKVCFERYKEKLKEENPFILGDLYFKDSHYLLIVVLNNMLELNISFVDKHVFKLRKEVKLLYHTDKFNMNFLEYEETSPINDMVIYIKENDYIEHSVFFFKHVVFYILRNDLIKASIYLANIRELLITLYGLKIYGKKVPNNEIADYEPSFVEAFQKTFTDHFNQQELLKITDYTFKFLLNIINDETLCTKEDYKRYQIIYNKLKEIAGD